MDGQLGVVCAAAKLDGNSVSGGCDVVVPDVLVDLRIGEAVARGRRAISIGASVVERGIAIKDCECIAAFVIAGNASDATVLIELNGSLAGVASLHRWGEIAPGIAGLRSAMGG